MSEIVQQKVTLTHEELEELLIEAYKTGLSVSNVIRVRMGLQVMKPGRPKGAKSKK